MRPLVTFAVLFALPLSAMACDARPAPEPSAAPVSSSPSRGPSPSPSPTPSPTPTPTPTPSPSPSPTPTSEDAGLDASPHAAPVAASAADAGPPVEYKTYTNDKWGFAVDVPTLFSRELKSGPGSRFLWPSATGTRAEMYAWGAHYVNTPIQDLYADWTRRPLTFKELKGNVFVVRGKEGGRLFYSRSILQDGMLTTVEIDYVPELAEWVEPVILHVNESYKFVPLGFRKNRMKAP